MDIMECIRRRFSCRAYQSRPVESEKLDVILEAARLAPSARNMQDWRFVVVVDPEQRSRLKAATFDMEFVGQAPVVIAACSTTNFVMRCGQPMAQVNVSIALEHMALTATWLGLASCWVGAFRPYDVRKALDIPTHIQVIELMTIGYADGKGVNPKKKSIDEIVCRDRWNFVD